MKWLLCFPILGFISVSQAAQLTVDSYDMINGGTGSFRYWDLNYNGTGSTNVDYAQLSGGTGDLTDGVIATQNWNQVENSQGTGPYVGWANRNPIITFNLDPMVELDTIVVYADDANGAGGVSLPDAVVINGTSYDVDQGMIGAEPKALTFSGLGITSETVTVQLMRSNSWVFVSEVEFYGEAVPEPATMAALGLGLAAVARRRRRA